MASTILTLLAVQGFRNTIAALTSTQITITTTPRPKYALIRSKKIMKCTSAANGKRTENVRYGRPEVYRLVGVGREQRPECGLDERENTIDVWRRVENVYEAENGTVKERWTMKMPLDRGLRQVVRDLRQIGSGQDEDKELREKKVKRKKDTTSTRTTRKSKRRDAAMSNGEDERQQCGGSNSRSSTLSTVSMQVFITPLPAHQRQRASAKDLLKSPKTTDIPTSNTMQTPYASQSQRGKSRPSVSSPPFGQPTMSPEQSANFVFGNRNSNAATSLLTDINGSTIRTVSHDGDHEILHQEAKKRSSGVQFVAEQASAFTTKGKPQTMAQITGSLGNKSSRFKGSVLSAKANGNKWIQEEEEREALLEMNEEEEDRDNERIH